MKSWLAQAAGVSQQRWDIGYHAFHQANFLERWSSRCNLVPLGEVIYEDSYGILTPGDVYAPGHPVTYVRVTDMRTNMAIDYGKTLRVPEEYYRHARARLRKHDVLLAVKGASIASDKSVAFVEEPFPARSIVNGTIFRFQVNKDHNPFFVAVMLDSEILKGQIRDLQISNNAVSYVDKPSIHALRIPLPPRSVQDRIAQVMQDANAVRQAKLAEAEATVNGIDDKIREALGVQVGVITDERALVIGASELEDRFDFKVYDRRYVSIVAAIEKGRYPVSRLGELCLAFPHRGTQPLYVANGDVLVLKTVNVGTGAIDFTSALRTTREFLQSVSGRRAKVQQGDILITSTGDGSWGRASVFDVDTDCIVDGHVTIVQLKTRYSPSFYEVFLNSSLGQAQFWQRYRGHTGQTEFYPDDIVALRVPVPPRDVQDRLATEVHNCRKRAQVLRTEAEALIVEAKARVERMILGEEGVP